MTKQNIEVYLIYYDTDNGNREEWNVFYTPCEVYTDKTIFIKRIDFLKNNLGSKYKLHTETIKISNDPIKAI